MALCEVRVLETMFQTGTAITFQSYVVPTEANWPLNWCEVQRQLGFHQTPITMSGEAAKISFAIGGGGGSSTASAPPVSNMAKLLAQAQARSNGASSTKSKPPAKAAKVPAASLFGDDDDDGSLHTGLSLAGPSKPRAQGTDRKPVSRAERKQHAEALRIDSTVFDYDGVYDGMKAAERQVEQAKKAETAERKPKYTDSFLAAAQTRKLDRLRAEEKMLQLEREKEGGEFDDKEKFVTEAYKKQMEEVRKAEEEERKREGESRSFVGTAQFLDDADLSSEEIRKSKKGPGLTQFYSNMLDDESKRHAAAVAASHGSVDSGPNLSIRPPTHPAYEPEAEYDPFLAQEEKDTGGSSSNPRPTAGPSLSEDSAKDVEINDDGEVVDKRSLLKAGLNIMKKPASNLPNSLLTSQKSGQVLDGPYKSRAVGTAASYAERMDRERKRLAEEMRLDAETKRAAEEAAIKAEEEAARKRREGNEGNALKKREEARLRFLERKRAREQEQEEKRKRPKQDESA